MKTRKRFVFLLLILLAGCSEGLKGLESDYTIRVFGDDQLSFSGYYAIAGSGAMPKPVHITGKAPAEFTAKGLAASCVIRKTTVEGMLKVEIMNGKEVVSAAETAAPYGIVTLGKIPGKNSLIGKLLGWIEG